MTEKTSVLFPNHKKFSTMCIFVCIKLNKLLTVLQVHKILKRKLVSYSKIFRKVSVIM